MTIANESTNDGIIKFEYWAPNGEKCAVCVLHSMKGMTDQQLAEVSEVLDEPDGDLTARVWYEFAYPMQIFTISFEAASEASQVRDGYSSISWEEFEPRLPEIKLSIRHLIAKNYGLTYAEDYGTVQAFGPLINGDLLAGYLDNFGQDDCVIGLFWSRDNLSIATEEILSTWRDMGVEILADQQDTLELTDSSIGPEATFCMRYYFTTGECQTPSEPGEAPFTETSSAEDCERNAVALTKRIREIFRREGSIQEMVQKHGGEVAGLRRDRLAMKENGEERDLNTCTRIWCRFQDEVTRDCVVQEVLQNCEAYNVTVDDQVEDWLS